MRLLCRNLYSHNNFYHTFAFSLRENMIRISKTKLYNILKTIINPRFYRGFFRFRSISLILLTLPVFFNACKDYESIGLDLISNPLNLKSETIAITAYTQLEDSLVVNGAVIHLLGLINDPVFGKTKAGIFTEALPRTLPPVLTKIHPDSLVIDSVVLSLAYVGYAGDTAVFQRLRVYEIDDIIPLDSIYSNHFINPKRDIEVLNPEFRPFPKRRVFFGEDTIGVSPHLRVRLDPEFGRKFVRDMDSLETNNAGFSNYDQFRNYLKGLYITVDDTNESAAILYFNLASTFSKIQIFYRNQEKETNNVYELPFGATLNRSYSYFDNFDHQFTSEPLRAQVLDGQTELGKDLLYVQSMVNYKVRIILPPVDELIQNRSDDIAINSARLIIPVDPDYAIDSLNIAQALILYREDGNNAGQLFSLSDQLVTIPGYFGGNYVSRTKEYSFNISRHLQMILENPELNTPLVLRVSGSIQNAGKVVLQGTERDNPMRLEIKYTQPSK